MSETVSGVPVPSSVFATQIGKILAAQPSLAAEIARNIPTAAVNVPGLIQPDGSSIVTSPNGTASASLTNAQIAATHGTTTLTAANAQVITPKWFGAAGNGTTDDTNAINAYIAQVRALGQSVGAKVISFHFDPYSIHMISNTIDFGAGASTYNPVIKVYGNGATITGTCPASYAMVEALDCANGSFIQDLHIFGTSGGPQAVGVLHGYSTDAGSTFAQYGAFRLLNANIQGDFAIASHYNRGADSSIVRDLITYNTIAAGSSVGPDSGGFATVIDPIGFWPILSASNTLSALTGNTISAMLDHCTFQSVNGPPLWVSGPFGTLHFANQCYAACSVGSMPGCVIYLANATAGNLFGTIDADIHFEQNNLTSAWFVNAPWASASGSNTNLVLDRFKWKDDNAEPLVLFDSSTYCNFNLINHAEIHIGWQPGSTQQKWFGTPANWRIGSGTIADLKGNGLQWNEPAIFNGEFVSDQPQSAYTGGFYNGAVKFTHTNSASSKYIGGYPLDVSGTNVIAANGTAALAINKRNSLKLYVEDFGVVHDPNGTSVASNTANYQAALNVVANSATLTTLVQPRGTTVYHTGLTVPSGTILQLDGAMYLATSATQGQVLIVGSNYAIFSPGKTGVIDQQNVVPANYGGAGIWSPNDYAGGSPTTGNPAQSNGYIFGLEIRNCKNWPVSISNTSHVSVMSCYLHDSGSAPQFVGNCSYALAKNNRIENIADYGFCVYQGGTYCRLIGNTSINCGSFGILTDGGSNNYASFCDIIDNTIIGASDQGIAVLCGTAGVFHSDILVKDNKVIACGTAGFGVIQVSSGLRVKVKTNIISGGGGVGTGSGILIGADDSEICDNTILNVGGATGSQALFIGASLRCKVSGNVARDTRSTPLMTIGMEGVLGAGAEILDNDFGTLSNPYSGLTLQPDTILRYSSPAGQVTQATNIQTGPTIQTAIQYAGGGGSFTVAQGMSDVFLNSASTVSSWAVTLPVPVVNAPGTSWQDLTITVDCSVTSFSVVPSTGTGLGGYPVPASLSSGNTLRFRFYPALNGWTHVVSV